MRPTIQSLIAKAVNQSEESATKATGCFGEAGDGNAVFHSAGEHCNESDTGLTPSSVTRYDIAREFYAMRRKIDRIFDTAGFAVSPAWDIMLDLFQAHGQSKSVSVTSACLGAACPPTTALRYLGTLEENGLVERVSDSNDKRRAFIKLTEEGQIRMQIALDMHLNSKYEISD